MSVEFLERVLKRIPNAKPTFPKILEENIQESGKQFLKTPIT